MARPKKRRKGQLRGLAELLRRVHPAPEQIDEARVFGFWLTALPEKIVSRARPTRLQHGILHVNVISSAWAQELHHMHTWAGSAAQPPCVRDKYCDPEHSYVGLMQPHHFA